MAGSSTPATTTAKGKVVQYVGTSDVRRILKRDWTSLEIDQDAVEWSSKNKFTVKAEDLSAPALEYLASADGFVVKDAQA